jgi:arylsulfatase A-like enzyme
MPNLLAMQKEGTTFDKYIVSNSLCCPSRSSIFTGQFPHNSKVMTNEAPTGGYGAYMAYGNAAISFAPALQAAGYKTSMLGKFLNGYIPKLDPVIAGWSDWYVMGGGAYDGFNYRINDNGVVREYGAQSSEYATDVLAAHADAFIRSSGSQPFFIEIATYAPHAPYVPAPRHAALFPDVTAPRSPAFGVRAMANAPKWQQEIPPLSKKDVAQIDHIFRKRVQSVQAIDEMLGRLRATLAEQGKTNATYVVFSSDNGFHLGEYSLRSGKMTPFDTDVRVPLIVTGPGVAKNHIRKDLVSNIDLAPTFAEWAGTTMAVQPDGQSFAALLTTTAPPTSRVSVGIEHLNYTHAADDPDAPVAYGANPPTYTALRFSDAMYVEYDTKESAYYDLRTDPFELNNIISTLTEQQRLSLKNAVLAHQLCRAQTCIQAQTRKVNRPVIR